jgi:hypothetical protein
VAVEPTVQWPFGWYFRDLRVNYLPGPVGENAPEDVLITEDRAEYPLALSERYQRSRLDYSRWSWWIREVDKGDVAGMLRFMLQHDHWGEEDGARFDVWTRKGLPIIPTQPQDRAY